ncbi:MAG: LysR family transcriptional regulator [Gammaproteobacteria bacterium]|nr:LysR family transcriptional regulator [Gammaproteobacteria bacterium]
MSNTDSTNKINQIRQLRAFCKAAQSGSISKAAERLKLSQPSVSLQIQALEKELDTLLFERCGPKIRLTPAGDLLLDIAHPLVEGVEKLGDTFAARLGSVNAGSLNIASGEATLLYILPDIIKNFSTQYAQVDVKLHNVTGKDGMALLRADEVDFAVGSMMDVPDDMIYHPIYSYEPALITSLDHPLASQTSVTLEDISPHGLILPPRHLNTWNVVDLVFQQHEVPYSVVLEAGGWEVIKRYVEIGTGISIVTSICLRGFEKLAVIPMDQYFPTRSYGVVHRRGKFLSPQAKCFLEMMDPEFFSKQTLPPARKKTTSSADSLVTNL